MAKVRYCLKTLPEKDWDSQVVIEASHLMRVDGIEWVSSTKCASGPVAAYIEAITRVLERQLKKAPEELVPTDLDSAALTLSEVDRALRRVAKRASHFSGQYRTGSDFALVQSRMAAIRQRLAARMLSRLSGAFVLEATQRIKDTAGPDRFVAMWV